MSGPKPETVKLMLLAKKLRREGWGYDTILVELVRVEEKMNGHYPDYEYNKHHVRVTWRKVKRWTKEIPRGGRVLLNDELIESERALLSHPDNQ